ncbi:MAG: metallophosphoesterase [Planctomycetota bacterium]|nr:metallophosphoesterase [Planctomycetota bacterium]
MKPTRWSSRMPSGLLFVTCLLPLLSPGLLAGDPPRQRAGDGEAAPATGRVIAIGDVHGDFDSFFRLLRSLGLVGPGGGWQGGTARLVQTGDLLDRGAHSRRVVELLMRLEKEAREAGGRVTVLLGNHEVMNLTGDLAYVSAGEFAAFARDEEPEFREEKRRAILSLTRDGHPLLSSDYYAGLGRVVQARNFDRVFPRGYFAHRRAFSPGGKIGRWLLERDVVHVDGGTLFVHGGLDAAHGRVPAREINRLHREALKTYFRAVKRLEELGVFDGSLGITELGILYRSELAAGGPHPDLAAAFADLKSLFEGPLLAEDGPLWYRGLAQGNERLLAPALGRTLTFQGVDRVVVGHTRHRSLAVRGRFGGRVILIDTGMNRKVYGGRPSALLVEADGRLSVFEPPAGGGP